MITLDLTYGERLLAWRIARAYSQAFAAHELNVHTASLNAVEAGRKDRLPRDARLPEDLPTATDRGDIIAVVVRRRLRLRQQAMAERLGVHVYRVRCWESGKPGTQPTPDDVARYVALCTCAG